MQTCKRQAEGAGGAGGKEKGKCAMHAVQVARSSQQAASGDQQRGKNILVYKVLTMSLINLDKAHITPLQVAKEELPVVLGRRRDGGDMFASRVEERLCTVE